MIRRYVKNILSGEHSENRKGSYRFPGVAECSLLLSGDISQYAEFSGKNDISG